MKAVSARGKGGATPTSVTTHHGPWPASAAMARVLGSKLYFTGNPCISGHIELRTVRGNRCLECARQSISAYRATDIGGEKQREASRRWQKSRPPEWTEKERERKRLLNGHKRRTDPTYNERRRASRRKNRAAESAYMARRRARIYASGGHHTADDIKRLFDAQGGRCSYCRTKLKDGQFHVDHIIPLVKGGSNGPQNLQITCKWCNASKGGKDPLVYARKIGRLL